MKFDKEAYCEFYEKLSGFPPYEYQVKVAEHLIEGRNIILSVPTGAGKTWASIMPFLFAKNKSEIHFPQKMIYSLPLRALCNSIYTDVTDTLKYRDEFKDLADRQTGEFSNDKYFEKDIVFSTIDQTLSSFLCFPLALSQRQANINAGALIGSYLVFDEFHLLERGRSMATTLGMLRMLKSLSRFCIMTATLSDDFMGKLKRELPETEIVNLDNFKTDIEIIGSLKVPEGKESKKEIEVAEGIIDSNKIIQTHQNKTIVICNRVETAQRIYLELETWTQNNSIELVCLHSRFFDSDRKKYENRLKELFGKKSKKDKSAILIATQVVEAGIDISCEVMHTEIAPINALLQRMGRCARYTGDYGKIYVYDVLKMEERARIDEDEFKDLSKDDKKEIRRLKNLYLPYEEQLCKATFEKLKLPQNQKLNEDVTTRLVNEILKREEEGIWNTMNPNFNIPKIQKAWEDCKKNHYRDTIRDIQSLEAILVSDGQYAEKHPFSLQSIGMFKWSLVKWIKEVLEEVDLEEDWVVGILEEDNIIDFNADFDENQIKLKFRKINDIDDVIETFEILYLNAKYFHYDEVIGFNKERGNQFSPYKERKEKEVEIYSYRKDTFIQHTKGLLGAFEEDFLPSLDFIFDEFNQIFQTEINFKKLIELILILHDYGKLDTRWQTWMQEYQKELSLLPGNIYTYEEGVPLGHTGFNTKKEKETVTEPIAKITKDVEDKIFKKRGKRPSHSGVGAKLIIDVLEDWLDDDVTENVKEAASIAIARHHGVSNISYPNFIITDHNYEAIETVLSEYNFGFVELKKKIRRHGDLEVMEFGEFEKYLLYLFLVRILRLCDQKATDDFEKYLN